MERPKLEYAENCTLIHTYARKLEEYCDELEAIISKGDCVSYYEKEIQRLEKALDKACKRLESFDAMSYCPPEKHWSKEKWKEWCIKND